MKKDFSAKAVQLALRVAGYDKEVPEKILDLSQFQGNEEIVFRMETNTNGYSFFMLDVTLCEDNHWRLIEANGSNAALSSTAVNGDNARVKHLTEIFLSKGVPGKKCVVLFVHQFRFIHLGEFFCRAARFSEYLSEQRNVALRNVDEEIGNEEVTVVAGEISEVAKEITCTAEEMLYKGVPVALASNPNLLPELVRNHCLNVAMEKVIIGIFHEQSCTALIHDKTLQQTVCNGSGILRLNCDDAFLLPECMTVVEKAAKDNRVVVAKMNAGSGGTGVEFFTPWMSQSEVSQKLSAMEKTVIDKYGVNATATMYPVRFFEFAKAKEAMINGKGHLWDLRMEVLVRPGNVEIRPCVVRACPAPFDGSYSRKSVVSNLSGRVDAKELAKYMFKNPFHAESGFNHGLCISPEKLNELVNAVVKWSENAMAIYCLPNSVGC
ncbi:MAG TPA: hypothetical protein VFX43_13585 [Chitinophagaceae bacterium]|nr:hypothetical protein [Chitinophagaceae bacterium]